MSSTGDIASYFEVFATKKWVLTITIRGKKAGEMVPALATFHHSPATSNIFDNPALDSLLCSRFLGCHATSQKTAVKED